MTTVLLALGLVFLLEGLVLALAPSRLEEALRLLQTLPPDTIRLLGLLAMTGGGIFVWLATWIAP
ncbi:MAG: DUF2065 domain-containing protein [Pseudomonadota bacterium]